MAWAGSSLKSCSLRVWGGAQIPQDVVHKLQSSRICSSLEDCSPPSSAETQQLVSTGMMNLQQVRAAMQDGACQWLCGKSRALASCSNPIGVA